LRTPRKIIHSARYDERRSDKKWEDSVEGILDWMDHHQTILESSQHGSKAPSTFQKEILNTAFTAIEGHNVLCKTNEAAAHQVALDKQFVFMIYEDMPDEVVNHMLQITQKSSRNYTKISPCDWKGNECADDHLMRDCPTYNALNDREKLDHILKSGRSFNCYRKGHRAGECRNSQRCRECKTKHNTALHGAWQVKTNAVSLLTHNVSPISLLTSPVMVGTDNSMLKKETNVIHDNGATISLIDKEVADSIGLRGETRLLGLSTIGDPNVVQQAFKASINVHDSEGNEVGKAWVHVVSNFVDLKAVDWLSQAAKFPHLTSLNFSKPFIGGKCHILLGNDNHHLSAQKGDRIMAQENPQSYPYACLTPLGWCAARPTLPPVKGDLLLNMMVKNAAQQYKNNYSSGVRKANAEAGGKKLN
jgi:hypothetical protein